MRNKFDNILLGLLWLAVSTLGACFWFNTQYGFNIFANAHWKHLAYMQATQQPIKTSFYISIISVVIIAVIGMYVLVRPHFRKITLPVRDITHTKKQTTTDIAPIAPVHDINTPAQIQPSTKISETDLRRPARLNIGSPVGIAYGPTAPVAGAAPTQTAPPVTPIFTPPTTIPETINRPDETDPEMSEIFTSAGYKVLPAPMISGLQLSVLALGQNETVWIGATDMETSTLAATIAVMQQIFADTLEDIPITVHGFVIGASDSASPKDESILTFDSTNDLRKYISNHPNPPLDEEDAENFEAFSTFINTVIDYLRTL